MELTDHDRRLMAGTRDRMLMEQIEEAELAVTREEATVASYLAVAEKLRIMETRYDDCRAALRRAQWSAGTLFIVAVLEALAAVVRAW